MMRIVARLAVASLFVLPAAGAAQTSSSSGTPAQSIAVPPGLAIPKDMTPYYVVLLVQGKIAPQSNGDSKALLPLRAGHLAVETHAAMLPSLASLKITY